MTSPTPAVRWRRRGLTSVALLALLGGAVVAPAALAAPDPEVPTGSLITGDTAWHYLDDGLYGSYSNVMTEDVHPPILALRELTDPGVPLEPVTLAGPTCDSADVVARDYPMPALETGDVLISPMMGAYTSVTASPFNAIAATPIVMS